MSALAMTGNLSTAPVLSTPNDGAFEVAAQLRAKSSLTDDQVCQTYDVERTVAELLAGDWTRVALQFPDHMLVDAPRVAEALQTRLDSRRQNSTATTATTPVRVSILADTSYSACCVDEIAAEHADAQVVIHYGRTCLSPTSRIPVIYVYTTHRLDHGGVLQKFADEFAEKTSRVVVMADLTYQSHVPAVVEALRAEGYTELVATEATRDPAGTLPNRRLVGTQLDAEQLRGYALFHIAEPPKSLLLALSARFASLHILSVNSSSASASASALAVGNPTVQTEALLRRRFAKVLSLASAGVIGILVNTLSVSNFLSSIDALRDKITRAGKKSYTVVVGKLNPAKLANFPEIEGWVVVGCWESGLVEDDASYYRPVVTPFEMEVALMNVEDRVWGDDWWGGIEKLKIGDETLPPSNELGDAGLQTGADADGLGSGGDDGEAGDEDESAPPEYDLRTGRLISHSRPMRLTTRLAANATGSGSKKDGDSSEPGKALVAREAGQIASINGVVSPGAEYLRSQRTWQGLGSDFDQDASTAIEQGRSGIARGYQVGDDDEHRH